MHFDDLSRNSCIGDCPHLTSVGWLGAGHAFTTGDAPSDLVPLLRQHLNDHWYIFAAAGMHDCEFCKAEGRSHRDSRNLFIPSSEAVYLSPGMIVHYIEQHSYLPPEEFIEAVRRCPPQGSEDFMALLHDFAIWWSEMEASEFTSREQVL